METIQRQAPIEQRLGKTASIVFRTVVEAGKLFISLPSPVGMQELETINYLYMIMMVN